MKSPIDLLNEVKKLVFAEEAAPVDAAPVAAEATGYTLADGTTVLIDKLEAGGIVTLEDGTPAPTGEHTLADGSVLVVGEGGIISEIKPKEEEAPAVEPPAVEDMSAKFSAMEQRFVTLESDHNLLKEAFGKQSEALQKVIGLVEVLVNEPSGTPAETPNTFRRHSAETKEQKIKQYSQFLSKFKIQ